MTPSRYQTRFSNGFWKTFDTLTYSAIRLHYTQGEAVVATGRFNAPKDSK